jgi:hypothetical protein
MCKNKYFDMNINYYCMFVLDAFNLYNKLLVWSMADPEKCNGEHIIETLFLPSIYFESLHTYKDKIFTSKWNSDKF